MDQHYPLLTFVATNWKKSSVPFNKKILQRREKESCFSKISKNNKWPFLVTFFHFSPFFAETHLTQKSSGRCQIESLRSRAAAVTVCIGLDSSMWPTLSVSLSAVLLLYVFFLSLSLSLSLSFSLYLSICFSILVKFVSMCLDLSSICVPLLVQFTIFSLSFFLSHAHYLSFFSYSLSISLWRVILLSLSLGFTH